MEAASPNSTCPCDAAARATKSQGAGEGARDEARDVPTEFTSPCRIRPQLGVWAREDAMEDTAGEVRPRPESNLSDGRPTSGVHRPAPLGPKC